MKWTYLINVQNIQLSLLDNLLNQTGELAKHLAGEKFITRPVNGGAKVNAVRQTLNAQAGVGTQTERTLGGFTLQLQLGQATSVLPRVGLVLLHEFLGEVVDNDLVEHRSSKFVVMSGSQGGVHTTAASNHTSIRAGATEISHDNQLVSHNSFRSSIVGQYGSHGLVNELDDLQTGILGSSSQRLALSICEVGGDRNDGSVHFLTQVVGCGLLQPTEVTGSNLGDGDGVGGLTLGIPDGEGHSRVFLLRVGGLLAGCRVYRFETVPVSCSIRFLDSRTHTPCQCNL